MERRWGDRTAIRAPVRIYFDGTDAGSGIAENISASGVYVNTEVPVELQRHVVLAFASPGKAIDTALRLRARIVRRTQSGLGLEWTEYAPRHVWQLRANFGSARN